jgi:hypothetical protein
MFISVNAYGLFLIELDIEAIVPIVLLDGPVFCLEICPLLLYDMLTLVSWKNACACQV